MKILVVSHNPISTYSEMGKTLLSLFSGFRKEELCQFYIYPSYPDVDVCASYYRITDKQICKAFLTRRAVGGEVACGCISAEQGMYERPEDEKLYRNPKNKRASRALMRDAIWRLTGWDTKRFRTWLEREAPTCVFVAPGQAKFIYDIAIRIAETRSIPIVTYICDDFYFTQAGSGFLKKLQHRQLKKKTERLLRGSKQLVTISEELKRAYGERFRIPTEVVYTGSGFSPADRAVRVDSPQDVSFFGNVRNHRCFVLAQIGRTLDEINREAHTSYRLLVYTSEKNQQVLSAFSGISSVVLRGFLRGEAYEAALHQSHLLLHVEAFDRESRQRTKYSISTKIADYLPSGIPLIAYGPEEVASIRYLRRNRCAFVASTEAELKSTLLKALTDTAAREEIAENGLRIGRQFHCAERNSRRLRGLFERLPAAVGETT